MTKHFDVQLSRTFSIFHQLPYIFPKQREGRIGNHNISLFQQLNTFLAAKVAVAFKWLYPYFLSIGDTVTVLSPS